MNARLLFLIATLFIFSSSYADAPADCESSALGDAKDAVQRTIASLEGESTNTATMTQWMKKMYAEHTHENLLAGHDVLGDRAKSFQDTQTIGSCKITFSWNDNCLPPSKSSEKKCFHVKATSKEFDVSTLDERLKNHCDPDLAFKCVLNGPATTDVAKKIVTELSDCINSKK